MKELAIFGCTGSIGCSTLNVVRRERDRFAVSILTAGHNLQRLTEQIREFTPRHVYILEKQDAEALREQFPGLDIYWGKDGMEAISRLTDFDIGVSALVGVAGLRPTWNMIQNGKAVALANKEVLVAGGRLVMEAAKECRATLLTVDSEHSAIMQCLRGEKHAEIERILLTASGGPFFEKEITDDITPEEALRHPTWKMGPKITIDSATMMNKGFEVIEARWLFNVPVEKVQVVIHRQSIVHSMVEFRDGSIMANIAPPDMEIPIAYALSYPERMPAPHRLDIFAMKALEFQKPDDEKFPCLRLAIEAAKSGHSAQVVLNAANEVLVARFLAGGLRFTNIPRGVGAMLSSTRPTRWEAWMRCWRWMGKYGKGPKNGYRKRGDGMKAAIGQDSHRFEETPGKPLILGGVVYPGEVGLLANSDGDVVLHAITNAVSGITGRNILGRVADEMCQSGITDSAEYLREALKSLEGRIVHLSISMECLRPKISPMIPAMQEKIAELLGVEPAAIGITATTGEGLTDCGKGLGISVLCILTVEDGPCEG